MSLEDALNENTKAVLALTYALNETCRRSTVATVEVPNTNKFHGEDPVKEPEGPGRVRATTEPTAQRE